MKKCKVCGEKIPDIKFGKVAKFCSKECYQIWRKEKRRKRKKYDMKAQRKVNEVARSDKKKNGVKVVVGRIMEE